MDGLPDRTEPSGRNVVATPDDIDVWIGLDVGKDAHFADVLDDAGDRLHARAVGNDEADLDALLDRAAEHGTPGFVGGQGRGRAADLTTFS
jgi:hypothetical protein